MLRLPDSRPATHSPSPEAPVECYNETADGYIPLKSDTVIKREHLNPGTNDGQINHDHVLNGFSSIDVVVGSENTDSVTGNHDASKRDNIKNDVTANVNGKVIVQDTSANMSTNLWSGVQYAEGEMPAPPSYNDALSALYEAAASDAEH